MQDYVKRAHAFLTFHTGLLASLWQIMYLKVRAAMVLLHTALLATI